MREPARQRTSDQPQELPVGADPDRRLRDRQRDQLGVANQRPPPTTRRHRVLVGEDVSCNDKGFQIRHLELQSRGDTGLEALLRRRRRGPLPRRPPPPPPPPARRPPPPPPAVSHQASSTRRRRPIHHRRRG